MADFSLSKWDSWNCFDMAWCFWRLWAAGMFRAAGHCLWLCVCAYMHRMSMFMYVHCLYVTVCPSYMCAHVPLSVRPYFCVYKHKCASTLSVLVDCGQKWRGCGAKTTQHDQQNRGHLTTDYTLLQTLEGNNTLSSFGNNLWWIFTSSQYLDRSSKITSLFLNECQIPLLPANLKWQCITHLLLVRTCLASWEWPLPVKLVEIASTDFQGIKRK